MTKFLKVQDNDHMVRDSKSGAISFINNSKDSREIKRLKRLEAEQLKKDVNDLKSEMSEIKSLLQKLIER